MAPVSYTHLDVYKRQVFPLGEENEAYAQYFVGKSYLAPLTGADAGVGVSNVTFEPGCRNNWHVHHVGGQILLCLLYPSESLQPSNEELRSTENRHYEHR